MEKELNTNNSKKLIIGTSIIFCTVILILGMTFAYFTQSDTKNLDSLVTTNINDTLEYTDNTTYMRQELIPAKVEIAKQAYALEDDEKCIESNGYSACSMYEFNIKNKANVSQELIIDMIPTVNTFTNLYFIVYEIDEEGNSTELINSQKLDKLTEEMIQSNNVPTYNLKSELVLNPNNDKTYQVVFFINDTGTDQTLEDAGKQFGGTIKISSVATGQYIAKSFGTNCWTTELLSDNTYKLKAFHGIDNTLENINLETGEITVGENYGKINESCTGYINDDDEDGFYSVYIPSNVGGQQISTLGNELFSVMVMNEAEGTQVFQGNYGKINNIKIEEGITVIEDGCMENCETAQTGTFNYIGIDLFTFSPFENFSLNVDLPNTLEIIGESSFATFLDSITIPGSVTRIGSRAFSEIKNITFEEATDEEVEMVIEEEAFADSLITELVLPKKTKTIGHDAFRNNVNLTYVYIPENISEIGRYAFGLDSGYESSLTKIEFGKSTDSNNGMTIGEQAFEDAKIESLVIPGYVTLIGNGAFSNTTNLKSLEFEDAVDETIELTIGDSAFKNSGIELLTIPYHLKSIGNSAFSNNINLTTINYYRPEGSIKSFKLETIGDSAFYGDYNLNTVYIPENVQMIGDSAFYAGSSNESSLLHFVFEFNYKPVDDIEMTIGNNAFRNTKITTLCLPAKTKSIGEYAFFKSTLKNISFNIVDETISDSKLITIEKGSFQNTPLYRLELPPNVQTIGESAFEDSTIEYLILNEGLKTIGDSAFNSTNISSLYIPASVETIESLAFTSNKNLTRLNFENTTDSPSMLKTIGGSAFHGCNLTYESEIFPLLIPSSVTAIGQYAFESNDNTNNPYLDYIEFKGTLTLGNTDWYHSSFTKLNP